MNTIPLIVNQMLHFLILFHKILNTAAVRTS